MNEYLRFTTYYQSWKGTGRCTRPSRYTGWLCAWRRGGIPGSRSEKTFSFYLLIFSYFLPRWRSASWHSGSSQRSDRVLRLRRGNRIKRNCPMFRKERNIYTFCWRASDAEICVLPGWHSHNRRGSRGSAMMACGSSRPMGRSPRISRVLHSRLRKRSGQRRWRRWWDSY